MKALIFDFDGTILDTESTEFFAWENVYKQHGQELTLEYWLPGVGSYDVQIYPDQHLETLLGRPLDRNELKQMVYAEKMRGIYTQQPMDGVMDWIFEAQSLGLKLAVASSSSSEWVMGHLVRLGMDQYFEIVRTRDFVVKTKPSPELFHSAAKGLGLEARHCVVIEDSLNGVKAGLASGAFTIAVPNTITKSLDFSEAHLCLESLRHFSLRELLLQTEVR